MTTFDDITELTDEAALFAFSAVTVLHYYSIGVHVGLVQISL